MTLSICPGVAGVLFLVVRQRIKRIENVRVRMDVEFRCVIQVVFDLP
jgi:hypothetical protein